MDCSESYHRKSSKRNLSEIILSRLQHAKAGRLFSMEKWSEYFFVYDGLPKTSLSQIPTRTKDLYETDADYEKLLSTLHHALDKLQSTLFAQGKYGVLVIFQALDAAGKDGTIKAVFSGINPAGVAVHSFKRPNNQELSHDFLWRSVSKMPEKGQIAVHNRSYYEEVLVVKVHPDLLASQQMPEGLLDDKGKFWKHRFDAIRNYEQYLCHNGIEVIKFYLHVSKKEQKERLLARLNNPDKNWKFEAQDVKERAFWHNYRKAYEEVFAETATAHAPWYVIPADDKKNMRLLVAHILLKRLQGLPLSMPETSPDKQILLEQLKKQLQEQDD